jgi:hypothetical protein
MITTRKQTNQASALNNVARQVLGALGLAGLSAWSSIQHARLMADRAALIPATSAPPGVDPGTPSGSALLHQRYQQLNLETLGTAYGNVFILAAVLTGAGVFLAAFPRPGERTEGVSPSVVYRWFRGKDELVGAAVSEVLQGVVDVLEDTVRTDPPPALADAVERVLTTTLARVTQGHDDQNHDAQNHHAQNHHAQGHHAQRPYDQGHDLAALAVHIWGRGTAQTRRSTGSSPISTARSATGSPS